MNDYPSMVFEFPGYDAVVPIICRRCGNCCKAYYVPVDIESLPEISRVIQQPIHRIQEELNQNLDLFIKGKPEDCLFLSGCMCLIHEIKPEPCRQFPSVTDFGPAMVDCPSHKEYKRIEKQFCNRGVVKISRPTSSRRPRKIPRQELGPLADTMKDAGASESLIREFINLNR